MRVDHSRPIVAASEAAIVCLTIKELTTHADIVDVVVGFVDLANRFGDARIFGSVVLNVRADTLTMESMLTRVDEELAIIENRAETDVAVLGRVDRDMTILHVASLCAELLSVLRVLADLTTQILDLLFVIIKAVTQVLLHIADLGLLREQVEQVFDL